MRPPYGLLASLRATVRECLAAIDLAEPQTPEVGRAFDRLAQGFEALGDPVALLRDAQPEERAQLEEQLSELSRLHAVLTATVARDRDRLCGLLERSRAARAALGNAPVNAVTGGTLDFEA